MKKSTIYTVSANYDDCKRLAAYLFNSAVKSAGAALPTELGSGDCQMTCERWEAGDDLVCIDVDLKHDDFAIGRDNLTGIEEVQDYLYDNLLDDCNALGVTLETSPKGLHIIYRTTDERTKTNVHPFQSGAIEMISGGRKSHLVFRTPYNIPGIKDFRNNGVTSPARANFLDVVHALTEALDKSDYAHLAAPSERTSKFAERSERKDDAKERRAERSVRCAMRTEVNKGKRHKDAQKYINNVLDSLGQLPTCEGERNNTLNHVAYVLGTLAGNADLNFSEEEARRRATKAGEGLGLDPDEVAATVESGITAGMDEPCDYEHVMTAYEIRANFMNKTQAELDVMGAPQFDESCFDRKGNVIFTSVTIDPFLPPYLEDLYFDEVERRVVRKEIARDEYTAKAYTVYSPFQIEGMGTQIRYELERDHNFEHKTVSGRMIEDIIVDHLRRNRSVNRFKLAYDAVHSEWDGKCRVLTFFTKYCGTTDSLYSRVCALMMFIRLYRAYTQQDFGCLASFTPVLRGATAAGKTSICRALCSSPDLFQTITDLSNIELCARQESGQIVCELAEVAGLNHADSSALLNYLSNDKISINEKYARDLKEVRRSALFIGTTNEQDIIRTDMSGENRRFFPIEVRRGRPDAVSADLPQLIAEAKILSDNVGFHTYILYALGMEILKSSVNEDYKIEVPMAVRISEALDLAGEGTYTNRDICRLLNIDFDTRTARQVGRAMGSLGIESVRKVVNGMRIRAYDFKGTQQISSGSNDVGTKIVVPELVQSILESHSPEGMASTVDELQIYDGTDRGVEVLTEGEYNQKYAVMDEVVDVVEEAAAEHPKTAHKKRLEKRAKIAPKRDKTPTDVSTHTGAHKAPKKAVKTPLKHTIPHL